MTNTVKRLILFFAALPVIASIILFIPWYGNIGVIGLLVLIGLLCGLEIRRMLRSVAPSLPRWSVLLPALAPLLSWAVNMGWIGPVIPGYVLVALVLWALSDSIFAGEGALPAGFSRIGSRLVLVMYPTVLLYWTARLTWFDEAWIVLLIFMFAVFLNDSGAWFFGILFGRHKNIFAVSPNKSLEGFLGGIFASVLVLVVASLIVPEILPHPLWQLVLFGILMGLAGIAGDLTESALKRSVGVKDSGNVILGRGGMLDSVDSIVFAAPVFVIFLELAG